MKKLMGATRSFFATKKITMYFFVAICLQLLGIQAGILRTGAIASAMEHTDELGKYLIPVIGWMVVDGITISIANYMRQRSNALAYTIMNDNSQVVLLLSHMIHL